MTPDTLADICTKSERIFSSATLCLTRELPFTATYLFYLLNSCLRLILIQVLKTDFDISFYNFVSPSFLGSLLIFAHCWEMWRFDHRRISHLTVFKPRTSRFKVLQLPLNQMAMYTCKCTLYLLCMYTILTYLLKKDLLSPWAPLAFSLSSLFILSI